MSKWYVRRSGKTIGPMPASELKNAARAGKLIPSDEVRDEASSIWIQAGSLTALAAIFAESQDPSLLDFPEPVAPRSGSTQRPSPQFPRSARPASQPPEPETEPNDSYDFAAEIFASPTVTTGDYTPSYSPSYGPDESGYERTVTYGTLGERWAAGFVDNIILVFINLGIGAVMGLGAVLILGRNLDIEKLKPIFNLVGYIVSMLWEISYISSDQQATPGKAMLGLKVTDLNGRKISGMRAAGRYFAEILSVCTLFIGYLFPLFNSKRQALHDMLAGTLVVKR